MNEELMRRISSALDAEGGVDADDDLRARLEDDAEARAYAQDLGAIDAALRGLGDERAGEGDAEPDWEALAATIDARLDADDLLEDTGLEDTGLEDTGLEDIGDVTATPLFADEDTAETVGPVAGDPVTESGAVDAAHAQAAFEAPPAAVNAQPREGQVVDLAARRRRRTLFATVGGLAAAAAVGLGVMAGLTTMGSDAEQVASAPATQSVMSEETATAGDMPADPAAPGWTGAEAAEPEAMPSEMPAAAAAEPFLAQADEEEEAPALQQRLQEPTDESTARAQRLPRRVARGAETRSAERLDRWATGGGGGGGIGGLGASARGGRAARPAPPAQPAPSRPPSEQPSRVDAIQALRPAEDAVRRCMGEQREVARVVLDVRADGAITTVNVAAPFAGTPAAACMERAIRAIRMPAASSGYRFTHAFRPAPIAGSSSGSGPSHRAPARRRQAPSGADEAMLEDPFQR